MVIWWKQIFHRAAEKLFPLKITITLFFNNKTRKQSRIVALASNISVRSWIGKRRGVVFGVEGGEGDPQGVLHLLHLLQTVFRLWRGGWGEGEGLRRRSSDELVKIGWKEGAEGGDPILQPDPHSKLCLNRRTKYFFVNCTLQRNQTNLWHCGRCQLFVSFFIFLFGWIETGGSGRCCGILVLPTQLSVAPTFDSFLSCTSWFFCTFF